MKLEQVEYAGWKNCLLLTNEVVEAVVTLDVGPRIIRFSRKGGINFFKEFESQCGQSGGKDWRSYGGHRLWHAPEVMPRTYYPDNQPVKHDWDGSTLTLTPPEELSNRLQMEVSITMDSERPSAVITHRIRNTGVWPVELTPWCLTVMAGGGCAVIPQEDYIPHGESYAPARPVVLWHYTRMNDPRLHWGDRFIQIREDPSVKHKLKIGAMNSKGWAAYGMGHEVFIKRFPFIRGAPYPDMGCNCEFYTEPGFLEIESLGHLTQIDPGASVEHVETWHIARVDAGDHEDDFAENVKQAVEQIAR